MLNRVECNCLVEIKGSHDVLALMDVSEKVEEASLNQVKTILQMVADQYEISPAKTHVAIITYSDSPKVVLDLTEGTDQHSVRSVIAAVKRQKGTANLDKALKKVIQVLRDRNNEMFYNRRVPTYLIVHMSDWSRDSVKSATKYMREIQNQGVQVFTVVIEEDWKKRESLLDMFPFQERLVLGPRARIINAPLTNLLYSLSEKKREQLQKNIPNLKIIVDLVYVLYIALFVANIYDVHA